VDIRLPIIVVALMLTSACGEDADLKEVKLAEETLGSGYTLLTSLQTLQTHVASTATSFDLPSGERRVRVLNATELAQQEPYADAGFSKDLVFVIVGTPPRVIRSVRGLAVTEIRCYTAEGKPSITSLHQRRLRELDPDLADKLLRQTAVRTVDAEATHCVYLQPYAESSKLQIELTLSFRAKQGCYAAKLRLYEPAPKF
jgi:hypothetical protein